MANFCYIGGLDSGMLPHQKRALAWMLHREQDGAKPAVPGGLLADDQGLGKTVTTIAVMLSHPPEEVCVLSASCRTSADMQSVSYA